MDNEVKVRIARVREIESIYSDYIKDDNHKNDRPFDGLRIRAEFEGSDFPKDKKEIPWAFPLLPKVFQSVPKVGEAVFIFYHDGKNGQRYYLGPIISQPQFFNYAEKKTATSLLKPNESAPLERISDDEGNTNGAFPKTSDVAVIGRGSEDIILRYDDRTRKSEIQLRAGVRKEPINDPNPNMIGNIIFNKMDPAYIQLKFKNGLASKNKQDGNSIINMVADRINIMSNKDENIAHNIKDQNDMIADSKMDEVMSQLHQVPMGDKLVNLLELMKNCIIYHMHAWSGLESCGDRRGYLDSLKSFDINSILSEYVRIS